LLFTNTQSEEIITTTVITSTVIISIDMIIATVITKIVAKTTGKTTGKTITIIAARPPASLPASSRHYGGRAASRSPSYCRVMLRPKKSYRPA